MPLSVKLYHLSSGLLSGRCFSFLGSHRKATQVPAKKPRQGRFGRHEQSIRLSMNLATRNGHPNAARSQSDW